MLPEEPDEEPEDELEGVLAAGALSLLLPSLLVDDTLSLVEAALLLEPGLLAELLLA